MTQAMLNIIKLPKLSRTIRRTMVPSAILMILVATGVSPVPAQQATQPAFPSVAEAGQTLFQAVQRNDENAIANILGGPTELTSAGDEGQDKFDRELFVQSYTAMHRFGREKDGSVTLYIGAENWPFPIPLVQQGGAWRFDWDAGLKEVVFRRVGENEFTAIALCREFVATEKRYRTHPGTVPVLDSTAGSLVAKTASGSTDGDPVLYHGYYFRVLATRPTTGPTTGGAKTTNGFVFLAYPAEYRSSGVMTFVITKNGVVYEKDLGANTSALAGAMTTFHKDATWVAAQD